MLRLTFLLCSGLFLVMLLGGRDFGQLRPGLAQAEALAKAVPVTADVPVVETVALANDDLAEPPVVAPVIAAPVVAAVAVPVAQEPSVAPTTVIADAASQPKVFTLANYGDPVAADPVATPVAAETSPDGEIWYVAGSSVNVRSGPSTDDNVVGNLTRGEATLVVWREGDEWARIRIEGDGIEGYVAMRFLSPNVPVIN